MQSRRWTGLLLAGVVAAAGWWAYLAYLAPYRVMPEARAEMAGDDLVAVEASRWLEFSPATREPRAGLVVYPETRVPPEAYAPAARALAAEGYLVAVVPVPFGVPSIGAGRAAEVILAHPGVRRWAVAGHGEGGEVAAGYARRDDDISGLVLWDALPAPGLDLSGLSRLSAMVVLAGDRGPEAEEARDRLPEKTWETVVEGATHAAFGWYVDPTRPPLGSVSRNDLTVKLVEATLRVLRAIDG
ncbi:MAG: alpha/beta hydrolase [Acidimicrobiia bacterium]